MLQKLIKILIIDDEEDHIALISRTLKKSAFEIIIASGIEEAEKILLNISPDIILTDFRLSDGTAREVVQKFSKNFPVIVMTSYGDEVLAVEMIKAGAIDYLVKSSENFSNIHWIIERVGREWEQSKKIIEAQEELEKRKKEIEDQNIEYKQLNKELIIAKNKAEESDRLKSSFLANMSHEIRTPMNGIIGFADLLENEFLSPEKKLTFIKIIKSSGLQLLSIINDIIDISKIETGQIIISNDEFFIHELLEEISLFFKPIAQDKGLHFEIENLMPNNHIQYIADRIKLKQILTNLISNAIKFTDEGNVICKAFIQSSEIIFVIKDTGIGIPEEYQKIIFERFRQADYNIMGKHGGTGLGLSISKAYIELMKGRIWLNSSIKKGSEFFISLPLIVSETDEIGLNSNVESKLEKINWSNKTVLVAEDEEINFLYVKEILETTNAKIFHVTDGKSVLKKFQETKPDILLLDIKMPGMNGYEVTSEIRKLSSTLPIIAITAFAFSGEKDRALQAGCNGFLHKPYRRDELLDVMKTFIGK